MFRKVTGIVFMVALAAFSPAADNFARRAFGVKAGVVLVESARVAGEAANYAPHVWSNLDANRRIKPPKVYFYNPSHESQYTAAVNSRWTNLADAVGASPPPAVGSKITKRDAPYWEVPVSTLSDTAISDFDILFVAAYGFTQLNSNEREKLRRFCDQGGVLWVDTNNGSDIDPINNFPVAFGLANGGGGLFAERGHPLLKGQAMVSDRDLAYMQASTTRGIVQAPVPGALLPIQSTLPADFNKFLSVASDVAGSFVSVARVGDGFMVVTTRGVGQALNYNPGLNANFSNNVGPVSASPFFDKVNDAAARLVLNMVYLPETLPQSGGGSRKSGSSSIDVEAPLLRSFDTTDLGLVLPGGAGNYQPATTFKGLVIVSAGNRVYAFDGEPKRDIDGDGDPDDGLEDLTIGAQRDLVWVSEPLNAPLSGPACAEVPSGPAGDQVWVVDGTGTLRCFDAFPSRALATNQPAAVSITPPNGPPTANFTPLPPTIHENLIFVADAQDATVNQVGRVWVADAETGQRVTGASGWQIGGSSTGILPIITASPTVGYVPIQDNSGGLDKVLYVPTNPNPSFGGPNSNAGFYSFWVGSRGERPSSFAVSGNQLILATRASGQGLDVFLPGSSPQGLKLTLLKPNGDPFTAAEMQGYFTGAVTQSGGILNVTLQPGITQTNFDNVGIRVDYHINWGTGSPSATSQILRGFMIFPDDVSKTRRVLGNIAMSPQGTIYMTVANPGGGGGAYYAIREEGRGSFVVKTRYEMYPGHTINLNQAGSVAYGPTLVDSDPLAKNPPFNAFLGGAFGNLGFSSGPVVHNGIVYVVARGTKNGFVPCSILMAFKAEPETVEIKTGSLGNNFTILQPDQARSSNKTAPEAYSTLQNAQFVYEKNDGADNGVIRIENLSATTRGPMLNSISTSQPVIVRRAGQPDLLIDPPTLGDRYNPLLWFGVLHGDTNVSPPLVTGNTLFVALASALPNILSGNGFAPTGIVLGIEADISPTDAFLGSASTANGDPFSRSWQKQLYRVLTTNDPQNPIIGNPAIVWPQSAGIKTFEDFRIRLLQTTLGSSGNAFGVVGGNGGAYAWSSTGLWGFTKSEFLVADENRIGRFDGSGNTVWTSNTSVGTGVDTDAGSVGNVKPLVRPTKAYALESDEMLVVDPGGNRIVRMDKAGRELRSIAGFKFDPSFTPSDVGRNAPSELREPNDALFQSLYVLQANNPFVNAQPNEFWNIYYIADTGNRRLITVVDRYIYNPTTRRIGNPVSYNVSGRLEQALGVLYWHSPAGLSGAKFDYRSLTFAFLQNRTGGPGYVYAAGFGKATPTRVDTGLDSANPISTRAAEDGNGGIVIFDGANSQVINEVIVPAVGGNVYWEDANSSWSSVARPQRTKKLGNLGSVTSRVLETGELSLMFTDNSGVYEIVRTSIGPDVWTVRWMMTREAYRSMRQVNNTPSVDNPLDFRPTHARRLESGDILITNGYTGAYRKANPNDAWRTFGGEVFMVDGDLDNAGNGTIGFNFNKRNLGFRSLSVRFTLPPVQGAREVLLPVFADRK